MRIPALSTSVTFPAGAVRGTGTVEAVLPAPAGGWLVLVDRTPFHPVDHRWPDQPADRGELVVSGRRVAVDACLTGAARVGGDELLVGERIPVPRGADGWRWFVLHEVAAIPGDPADLVGRQAQLIVDEPGRRLLSTGHTACHLAALALNQVLAGRWTKPVRLDGLGHPDFDGLAIMSSRVRPAASTDVYRIGKSLRKKGFDADGLAEALPELRAGIAATLAAWVAADCAVEVRAAGPELSARRVWTCHLPQGTPSIPCGGTHVRRLGELGSPAVELTLDEDGTVLTMDTKAAQQDEADREGHPAGGAV